MPVVCYIYWGTVDDDSDFGQNSRLFVFSHPPETGQIIALETTGKQIVLTDVNHYRMTIKAVFAEKIN